MVISLQFSIQLIQSDSLVFITSPGEIQNISPPLIIYKNADIKFYECKIYKYNENFHGKHMQKGKLFKLLKF